MHDRQPSVTNGDILDGQYVVPACQRRRPRRHDRRAAQVDLADLRAVPDLGRWTVGDHSAAVEHDNVIARLEDELDVVVDQQDRIATFGEPP